MTSYKYIAVTEQGKQVQGRLDAENVAELLEKLKERQLHCIDYKDLSVGTTVKTTYRMKMKEVVVFCKQLETMLRAGVSIVKIFRILCDKAAHPKMALLYRNVLEGIQKGQLLSEAMAAQGRSFPTLLIYMISSGEASGALDRVTARLSTHFDNDYKLMQKLRTALIYPAILLTVSITVILLLFTLVLPNLFGMFSDADMPAITRFLFGMSNFLVNDWIWVVLVTGLLLILLTIVHRLDSGRLFFDTMKLKFPKIGKMLRVVYTARFSNSMATLYTAGIPMIRSLEISSEILGNRYFSQQFGTVIERVSSGGTLTDAVTDSGLFDQMFESLLFIGEESGSLDTILEQASGYYDEEARVTMERMVALLEPVLIVVLAVIIGLIIGGTILPIYSMYGQVM